MQEVESQAVEEHDLTTGKPFTRAFRMMRSETARLRRRTMKQLRYTLLENEYAKARKAKKKNK
jgi:hypothetical protein|tara:strand:- start:4685 stop:4873 length:189 start_codon:yes stop_codon:yes gene_type:complete